MKRNLFLLGIAVVILLLLIPLPPGRLMIGGIHMTKHALFFIFCLVMLITAAAIHAHGSTGQGYRPPPPPGFQGPQGQYGFTGPARTVTVEQAKTFAHRTPVLITGTIVQFIGADCYTFRDSSGEITLRIGPREWEISGLTIGPSDNIEINGEVHRDESVSSGTPEVHARFIKRI